VGADFPGIFMFTVELSADPS